MSEKHTHSAKDVRLSYTKKAVLDTFLRLAANKDISKITTVEICREAGINRNTFYSYFYSVEDVFNEIKNNFFNEIDEASSDKSLQSEEICINVIRVLYMNIQFSKIIFTKPGNIELISEFFARYRDRLIKRMERIVPNITEKNKNMIYYNFIYGVSGILREWLNNEYTYSPDDISSFIIKYTSNGLNGFNEN